MDICGEHGADIAYAGRDCPACEEIENLRDDHRKEIDDIASDHEEEVRELQDQIDELENR